MPNTVITFASGKGGVGKTTLSANTAALLAMRGKRVIIADMDFGLQNLHHMLGIENGVFNLINAARGECAVESVLIRHPALANLYYIAGSPDKGYSELGDMLPSIARTLTALKGMCDYLILDAPAGIGGGFMFCGMFADKVFLVTVPEDCAINDVTVAASKLRGFGIKNEKIRLIINRVRGKMVKKKKHLGIDESVDASQIQLIGAVPETDLFLREQHLPVLYPKKNILHRTLDNLIDRIENPDTPFDYFWK